MYIYMSTQILIYIYVSTDRYFVYCIYNIYIYYIYVTLRCTYVVDLVLDTQNMFAD